MDVNFKYIFKKSHVPPFENHCSKLLQDNVKYWKLPEELHTHLSIIRSLDSYHVTLTFFPATSFPLLNNFWPYMAVVRGIAPDPVSLFQRVCIQHTDGIAHSTSRPIGLFAPETSPPPSILCPWAEILPVWLTFIRSLFTALSSRSSFHLQPKHHHHSLS